MEWNKKPYHSLDYEMKKRFGTKVYKIALDGGMTCPNRDGKIGYKGCIFCSGGGSGDFAEPKRKSVTEQINLGAKRIEEKIKNSSKAYIAYFQSYTNTYGKLEYLEKIFYEAINHENVKVLSIATRPDCLGDDVVELLGELNKIKPVWVELGLQTIHENTAKFIRRGYELNVFESAVKKLREKGIEVIVHVILGLPNEGEKEILETIKYLSQMDIQGIKLQLLHVLKDTDLGTMYEQGKISVLPMEDYIELVLKCIAILPEHIVVHRITGDGPKNILLAPHWSGDKKRVLNAFNLAFKNNNLFQGCKLKTEEFGDLT